LKTILTIKDEVNIKFDGLDLGTRKELHDKFKFRLPYAHHIPAVKLGRWDGCKYFFQLSGASYVNLLVDILPIIERRGYDIELQDERTSTIEYEFERVHKDSYSHFKWPKGHVHAGKNIELRDYQVELINVYLENRQGLQEVATGAGKTIITAILSHKCEKYGRTIVIVPSKSLVRQTEADYKILGLDVGVYYGDRKEYNKTHTICTWQSLNNLLKNTKEGEAEISIYDFLDGVCAVIVDEAHMGKAEVLMAMLTGIFADVPLRWGLTGTIPKEDFDFYAIRVGIGEVLARLQAHELQKKKVLADCHVHILQLEDFVNFKTYPAELKYLVTDDERIKYIAGIIKEISITGNTLVLIDRIATGKLLNSYFDEAVFINGNTKVLDRQDHYDEVAVLNSKLIFATYGIASIGINIPRIFNLVLLEPGKSFVRVIQSIGRGIRRAKDKDFVQIWDIASTSKYSKRHLIKRKQQYKDARYPFHVDQVDWK